MKFAFALAIAALAAILQVAHAAAVPRPLPDFELLSELEKRGVIDDIKERASDIWSSISGAGIWGYLPTPTNIKRKLGISDAEVAKLPIDVLNIPGYANWTGSNWNLRLHGSAYRTPKRSWDSLAAKFIPGGGLESLKDDDERNQARNLTSRLFSLGVKDVQFTFDIRNPADDRHLDTVIFPKKSDSRGEFNLFVPLDADKFKYSNNVQQLNVYTKVNGTSIESGNATAYLVPPKGPLVISDIDDILRVTKIFFPKEGILNSFARKFVPWMNMPEIFAKWKHMMPNIHFHYCTTTPKPGTALYMDFIYKNYPLGSFDSRPFNFSTWDQLVNIRYVNLRRAIQTFRQRHIVLIGDTSNNDVMKDYPTLMLEYPDTVKCILIRNVSAQYDHIFPYNTEHFKFLPREKYMFFNTPDDLIGLNFENGDCRNASVIDNPTFSRQNLPFGLGKTYPGEPFSLIKSVKQIGGWIKQKWKNRFS